ncbi:MAG: terminase family protein [Firmicutes bacterium]|nr:terminase family protein [Bacillota bacterium]
MSELKLIKKLAKIDKRLAELRKPCALSLYNSGERVHKKQLEFHKSFKRNRWVFGGNRSGKTECGAVEALWLCLGIHPYRQNKDNVSGWVVSVSTQVQRDVAQKKILHYLNKKHIIEISMISGRRDYPEGGVIDYIVLRNSFGGRSTLGFKSCDQGREKFQGASLDFVWFDEEPSEDIYNECKMRVLDKKGLLFGTMTPLKGLTFVHDVIYLNKFADSEVEYFSFEWADNPFLCESEIKQFSSGMSEDELETRRFGKFKSFSGLVYPEFCERENVIEPFDVPREWYDIISIDPGLNNPLAAHFYALDFDGNIYVVYEHYEAGRDICHHSNKIKEICKKLNWHIGFGGRYDALIDSAASQRTLASSKSVAELFYERGINVNTNINKDVFSGIARVKSALKNGDGVRRLFIFKNCVNMIRELKGYRWGVGDSPVKSDDHALDNLRYYIMSKRENKPSKRERSAVQRDKERLIRANKRKK